MAPDAAALVAAAVRAACLAKAHRRTVAAVAAAVTASCLQHARAGEGLPCNQRNLVPAEKMSQVEAEVDVRRAARRRQRQRKRARAAESKKTALHESVADASLESSCDAADADVMSVEDTSDESVFVNSPQSAKDDAGQFDEDAVAERNKRFVKDLCPSVDMALLEEIMNSGFQARRDLSWQDTSIANTEEWEKLVAIFPELQQHGERNGRDSPSKLQIKRKKKLRIQ